MIKSTLLNILSLTMPTWFTQLGYGAILLSAMIPFFPISSESIGLGILALQDSTKGMEHYHTTIINIAVIIAIGNMIGHFITYYAGIHLHKLHKSIKKHKELPKEHIFHKYGVWFLLGAPTISILVPPISDATMLYLGHRRANPKKLMAVIFVGELIKIPLTAMLLGGIVLTFF